MALPVLSLDDARAVVASPELHTRLGVMRACEVIDRVGTQVDRVRASRIRRLVELDLESRAWVDDAIGAAALFLLLVGGLWVGHGIGMPTGGDQLLLEVR